VGLHEHTYFGGVRRMTQMRTSAPLLYLAYGVTTAMTAGSQFPYEELNMTRAVDAGIMPGPRFEISGPYLNGGPPRNATSRIVTSPEEAGRVIAYWAAEGATWFKFQGRVTREVLRAGIEEAHARGLMGREDREPNAARGQRGECLAVDRALGEPHPLRRPAEPSRKVRNAPPHLRHLILTAGQRHDHMVVGLRDRVTVPARGQAFPVGIEDRGVQARRALLDPSQQRGADVERDRRVVVHDAVDPAASVENAGGRVRRVALGRDARVPVVRRRRRILHLDGLKPRMLARRLVEVAVDAEERAHEV
jgi:hypothetical protein